MPTTMGAEEGATTMAVVVGAAGAKAGSEGRCPQPVPTPIATMANSATIVIVALAGRPGGRPLQVIVSSN